MIAFENEMKPTLNRMKGAGATVLLLCFLMSVLLSGCGDPASGASNELNGTASITKYYTYGAFFQAEGTADLSETDLSAKDLSAVSLQLRTGNGEEDRTSFEIPFSASKQKLTFRTAKHIDEGLCLDTLETGRTAVFLELTRKDGGTELLALRDGTGSGKGDPSKGIEYYTLPYGHRGHRKVTTAFERTGDTETLVFETKRARLPAPACPPTSTTSSSTRATAARTPARRADRTGKRTWSSTSGSGWPIRWSAPATKSF